MIATPSLVERGHLIVRIEYFLLRVNSWEIDSTLIGW
jgi:hypothetical protein